MTSQVINKPDHSLPAEIPDFNDPEVAPATELDSWCKLATPINIIALAWALFQIGLLIWPDIDILVRRSAHVGFACAMALSLSLRKRMSFWLAGLLLVLSLSPSIYLYLELGRLYDRIADLDPVLQTDFLFGLMLLVLVLAASYLRLGWGLVILTIIFIFYQLLGGLLPGYLNHSVGGISMFTDTLFLAEGGLFGVPTGVSVEIIYYFILFAAIFDVFGGGRLLIDMALWLTGRQVGGPAKAAVVASALTGTVSGSAVANVMSVGIFTIPLMKRVGYGATFAAGVEAAASTGGQIMPPVMGAGAFIMADFLQIPYKTVMLGALFPALLYFTGLFVAVHLQARFRNITIVDSSEIKPIGAVLRGRWHLLLPLLWLIFQMVRGYDLIGALVQTTLLTILAGSIVPTSRRPLLPLIEALMRASERAVVVALPCALASVIVMVISLTGLGTKFSSLIIAIAGGNLFLAVALGGLGALILGCGMPTTSAYIMAAILVAPALVQLGIDPLVAHLYIFYLAVLSMVTPPVALAAYAAASLAGCSATAAGLRAFQLALPALAISAAMVLQPSLVLWGGWELLFSIIQAASANALLAVTFIGWLGRPLGIFPRVMAFGIVILMLWPSLVPTLIGFALALGLVVYGYMGSAWKWRSLSKESQ